MNVYFRHNAKRGKIKKGNFLSVFERKSTNWNLSPSWFAAEFRSVQVMMELSCFQRQTLGATLLPKGQTRLLMWNRRVCVPCVEAAQRLQWHMPQSWREKHPANLPRCLSGWISTCSQPAFCACRAPGSGWGTHRLHCLGIFRFNHWLRFINTSW